MSEMQPVGTPHAGEIHVWRFLLDDDAHKRPQLLSADELLRYGQLQNADSRHRFLATRVALRTVLAGYIGASPDELVFSYNANGKPALTGAAATDLQFNVSHSGSLGMLAVTGCAEIGIDVEQLRAQRDYLALARRFFSADELQALQDAASSELFYRMWTLKEARVKLRGERLLAGIDKYRCRVADDGRIVVSELNGPGDPVCDSQWLDSAGYVVAVATNRRHCRVRRLELG